MPAVGKFEHVSGSMYLLTKMLLVKYPIFLWVSTFSFVDFCFCRSDEIGLMPTSRATAVFTDESYTMAVLNSTYVQYRPGGPSLLIKKSDNGKFGDHHASESSGVLVHVMSAFSDDGHTACYMPLKASFGEIPKNERWIALVKRGKCSFQVKMENAFSSNASGIIVYNDKRSNQLEKMRLQQNVPGEFSAVFTYKWKGEELAEIVDNGTRVFVEISVGEVCNKQPSNVNKTSVLFVSVSFVVLMVVSLGWIIFYYVQKCRYLHAKDRLSKRLTSAAKKALQKIPTRHIKADDKDFGGSSGEDSCAICIELFKPADIVRLLPCKHEFHKLCIDPWLLEHRTCPMCKMDILKYFGFELTGSQESMLRIDQEDPFNDLFYFNPNPQNFSAVLETSAIVPVTISHHSRFDMENRPSTSAANVSETRSANAEYSTSAEGCAADRSPVNEKNRIRVTASVNSGCGCGPASYSPLSPPSSSDTITSIFFKALKQHQSLAANPPNIRRSASLSSIQHADFSPTAHTP